MENKLAENIRNYRKDLGFTQEQLAERLGVTLGAVSKWERGSSEPDLSYSVLRIKSNICTATTMALHTCSFHRTYLLLLHCVFFIP